jgi:hypothetical protein
MLSSGDYKIYSTGADKMPVAAAQSRGTNKLWIVIIHHMRLFVKSRSADFLQSADLKRNFMVYD